MKQQMRYRPTNGPSQWIKKSRARTRTSGDWTGEGVKNDSRIEWEWATISLMEKDKKHKEPGEIYSNMEKLQVNSERVHTT